MYFDLILIVFFVFFLWFLCGGWRLQVRGVDGALACKRQEEKVTLLLVALPKTTSVRPVFDETVLLNSMQSIPSCLNNKLCLTFFDGDVLINLL